MSKDGEYNDADSLQKLRQELMAPGIAARLKLLVLDQTPEKRRFPTLERLTGVKESTWRTWWQRGASPNGALVEGAARAWPEYAFWLATGLTDVDCGHRMPQPHLAVLGYLESYPEGPLSAGQPISWNSLDIGSEDDWPSDIRALFKYTSEYLKVARQMQDESQNEANHEILGNSLRFIREKRLQTLRAIKGE